MSNTNKNILFEDKLEDEIRQLKSALDRSPVSIMMTDVEANITYINTNYTKMSGYSSSELIGKNPRILKSGYTTSKQYEKMWEELTSGNVWTANVKNIAKDGSEFWENSTIIPSLSADGKVDGYIAFKLEITNEIKMKEELIIKEEIMIAQSRHAAMGEMISMIAHQWRQPITAISMGANNILVDIELEEFNIQNIKNEMNDISEQTIYLSKTIDDFRNFFRPNKEKEEVFIHDIIHEALEIVGKTFEYNNIKISLEGNCTEAVKVYSRELLQVFLNILKNANEALVENRDKNRFITIVISKNKNVVLTTIFNNGGTIPDDVLPNIFDPYFSTKDEQTGTGLGLYMSETIIEKHMNGKLIVENKNDGVCFTIILPNISNLI